MRSAFKRFSYFSKSSLQIYYKKDVLNNKTSIYVEDLKFVITPELEGIRLHCNTGLDYFSFIVTKNHIGFKAGSFVTLKKRANHESK